MKKLELKDIEDLRMEFDRIIKDRKTTDDNLIYLWDFFKGFTFVVDNEIRIRFMEKHSKGKLLGNQE